MKNNGRRRYRATGCRKQQFDAELLKQIVEPCDIVYIFLKLICCYIFPRLIRIDNSMPEQLGGCSSRCPQIIFFFEDFGSACDH